MAAKTIQAFVLRTVLDTDARQHHAELQKAEADVKKYGAQLQQTGKQAGTAFNGTAAGLKLGHSEFQKAEKDVKQYGEQSKKSASDSEGAFKKFFKSFKDSSKELQGGQIGKQWGTDFSTGAFASITGSFSALGTTLGSLMGTAIAPGIGTAVGATIGSGVDAALEKVQGPLLATIKSGIELNKEIERATVHFESFAGNAEEAGKHLDELRQLSLKSGLDMKLLIEGSERLEEFTSNLGVARDIMKAAAVNAILFGKGAEGFDNVANALGRLTLREELTTRGLMQLERAGIAARRYLAEALGIDQKHLEVLIKQQRIRGEVAAQIIAEKYARERGARAAEVVGGTVVGREAQVGAQFQILSADATQNLMRGYGDFLTQTSATLSSQRAKQFVDFFNNFSGAIINQLEAALSAQFGGLTATDLLNPIGLGQKLGTKLGNAMKNNGVSAADLFHPMELGEKIGAGLPQGISSGGTLKSIVESLVKVRTWIDEQFKEIFDARSPSRWAADNLGVPIGAGVGLGTVAGFEDFMNSKGKKALTRISGEAGRAALAELLKDPKIAALIKTLELSEHGAPNRIVGGKTFSDFSKHPNVVGVVTEKGPSTAAGLLQETASTFNPIQKRYGLPDFSPQSQELAGVAILLGRAGSIAVLQSASIEQLRKLAAKDWTSVPGSTIGGGRQWSFEKWMAAFNTYLAGGRPPEELAQTRSRRVGQPASPRREPQAINPLQLPGVTSTVEEITALRTLGQQTQTQIDEVFERINRLRASLGYQEVSEQAPIGAGHVPEPGVYPKALAPDSREAVLKQHAETTLDVLEQNYARMVQDLDRYESRLSEISRKIEKDERTLFVQPGEQAGAPASTLGPAGTSLAKLNPELPKLDSNIEMVAGDLKDFTYAASQADPAIADASWRMTQLALGVPPVMKGVTDAMGRFVEEGGQLIDKGVKTIRQEAVIGASFIEQLSGALSQVAGLIPGQQASRKRGLFSRLLGFAAPFLSLIPGVGPLLSFFAGVGGNIAGGNYGAALGSIAGALQPGAWQNIIHPAGSSGGGSSSGPPEHTTPGGHMALGGPGVAGQIYWTGEHGPEPFVAPANGYFLSHQDAMSALAAASAVQTMSGPGAPADRLFGLDSNKFPMSSHQPARAFNHFFRSHRWDDAEFDGQLDKRFFYNFAREHFWRERSERFASDRFRDRDRFFSFREAFGALPIAGEKSAAPLQSISPGSSFESLLEHRAAGGPGLRGEIYWTGEHGPEPFAAPANGYFLSHQDAMSALAVAPAVQKIQAAPEAGQQLSKIQKEFFGGLETLSFEHRGWGGLARRGQTYLVGEHGPEPFMAPASGFLSRPAARSALASFATGPANGVQLTFGPGQDLNYAFGPGASLNYAYGPGASLNHPYGPGADLAPWRAPESRGQAFTQWFPIPSGASLAPSAISSPSPPAVASPAGFGPAAWPSESPAMAPAPQTTVQFKQVLVYDPRHVHDAMRSDGGERVFLEFVDRNATIIRRRLRL